MSKQDFKFEKFMKDICEREDQGKKRIEAHREGQEESPQRKYNRLYREHWQNSTRFGRRK